MSESAPQQSSQKHIDQAEKRSRLKAERARKAERRQKGERLPEAERRQAEERREEEDIERIEMLDPTPAIAPGDPEAGAAKKTVPLPLKVFGVLNIVVGVAVVPVLIYVVLVFLRAWGDGQLDSYPTASVTILMVNIALAVVLVALFARMGYLLLKNESRVVARLALVMISVDFALIVTYIMLGGIDNTTWFLFATLIFLTVLSSYLDPALSQERALQRTLRDMDMRDEAESGTLGLDRTGQGYIKLNFFNLFWIFVICCILGLLIETAYHAVVFGGYQDRAGLLYGPFSPIYGIGGVLVTIALNRFYRANPIIVFLVSAVIGGAFEFFVSWFLQFSFGITAWDYTGTFMSIGGRTNFEFMCMWGVLGIVWVKLLLPLMLKIINVIPWNWRYIVTTVCAVLMAADCVLSLVSLDSWYSRLAGQDRSETTAIEQFCDTHYDNDYMANRFQSMSIDPENTTRAS